MLRATLFLPFLVCLALATLADDLDYRDRDDRWEGIKRRPIRGHDVELLGARVESPLAASSELEDLSVRFFLESQDEVYLTLRERNLAKNYWLDRARPPEAWRPKAANVFTWPSGDVLKPLGLEPSDLLVLVRLATDTPGSRERVAPAMFPAAAGGRVTGYRFTFKTNDPAKIGYRLLDPQGTQIASGEQRPRPAGLPFDVRWPAGDRPEGRYSLLLEGYFVADNTPIVQEVEFFHTASWPL